jgi:hypothetical protein
MNKVTCFHSGQDFHGEHYSFVALHGKKAPFFTILTFIVSNEMTAEIAVGE